MESERHWVKVVSVIGIWTFYEVIFSLCSIFAFIHTSKIEKNQRAKQTLATIISWYFQMIQDLSNDSKRIEQIPLQWWFKSYWNRSDVELLCSQEIEMKINRIFEGKNTVVPVHTQKTYPNILLSKGFDWFPRDKRRKNSQKRHRVIESAILRLEMRTQMYKHNYYLQFTWQWPLQFTWHNQMEIVEHFLPVQNLSSMWALVCVTWWNSRQNPHRQTEYSIFDVLIKFHSHIRWHNAFAVFVTDQKSNTQQ